MGVKMKKLECDVKAFIINSIHRNVSVIKEYYSISELNMIKSEYISGIWLGLISLGYKIDEEFGVEMINAWDNAY